MDDYWDKPELNRCQAVLFSPTLEEMIDLDHPVRFFDEVFGQVDWALWESHYHGRLGQPPLHPRVVSGAILYGLKLGIRSSRQLEDACRNRLDFIWLVEGRVIDHSTFCDFRKRFKKELKDLFGQIGRVAMGLGMVHLVQIAIDGTRVRSNSSRHRTATAQTLAERLADLDAQLDKALSELDEADRQEQRLFGSNESANKLPPQLSDLQRRREQVAGALSSAQAQDRARQQKGGKRATKPAQVPVSDPASRVLPNKEGGFAPNYTPMVTTDGQCGVVLDADVIDDSSEASVLVPAVERIEQQFGRRPQEALADGIYGTGQNLEAMEDREVQLLTPVQGGEPAPESPARRADPSVPIDEDQLAALPVSPQTKKLDRSAFVYDSATDCYFCPMGKQLAYERTKQRQRSSGQVEVRVYRCKGCTGCPLGGGCLADGAQGRTIERDPYEAHRQRAAARMEQEENKAKYKQRLWIVETTFGHIKSVMGIRRFLLRGLENVQTEWMWICTAFNIGKVASELARLRRVTIDGGG